MPYSKIHPDDMILRDHLAYERTFLSYARTSITLIIAGGTLIKFLHFNAVTRYSCFQHGRHRSTHRDSQIPLSKATPVRGL